MLRRSFLGFVLIASACAGTPCTAHVMTLNIIAETPVAEPASNQRQLHGVGTYFGGQIPVFVGPSKRPQVLSLMSFNAAIWHVYLLPGANLAKIYLSGFNHQRVVVERSRLERRRTRRPRVIDLGHNLQGQGALGFGPPMRLDGTRGAAYLAELRRETGLQLTGFIGREQVCLDDALVVSMAAPPTQAMLSNHFPRVAVRDLRPAIRDFKSLRRDLRALVVRGKLPRMMPLFEASLLKPSDLKHWPLLPPSLPTAIANATSCGRIEVGSVGDDGLPCSVHHGFQAETLWIVGGPGRDVVGDDDELSQVLSGGAGDDIIDAGRGNDVIYFGRRWGHDALSLRCPGDPPEASPGETFDRTSWDSRYIVFGRGVHPANLRWISPTEIEDRATGSRIKFVNEVCGRFVAVERGRVPPRPRR